LRVGHRLAREVWGLVRRPWRTDIVVAGLMGVGDNARGAGLVNNIFAQVRLMLAEAVDRLKTDASHFLLLVVGGRGILAP
jgi:hypothetical protein